MNTIELKSLIDRRPFKAFSLATDAGLTFYVGSPDHIAVNPFTDEIHLFTPTKVIYLAHDAVRVMNEGTPLTHD